MFSLFLWGLVFRRLYSDKNISSVFMVLVLPLSAFVFTPFWNIFYFFSIQERFIVFFAPIALLCFMEARRGGLWYVFGGLFACAGMLLGKETSLAFFAAVIAAAVFSAVHDRRFRDFFPIALAAVAMFAYAMFIKSIISGYSQRYAQGLSVAGLLAKIAAVPAVVKLIVLVSVIALLFALFRRRSNDPDPWWTVCPFFCIAYAAILLPWGYPPYLMSALGPFLVGMFFAPLYALRKNRIVFGAGIFFMVVVIAAVTAGVIVPNIEKKASISQVVAWIGAHRGEISGVYAPKPLIEATFAFEKMTRVPFILVGGDRLDAESLSRASHLIVERDAVVVRLQGVEAVGPVYVNSHWVVYALEKNDAVDREFLHQFTETAIQKIKYAIKKL
jgi:hypothetical protein